MHRISVSIKLFQFKLIHLIRISDFIVLVLLNFVHPLPTESFVGGWDVLLLWLLLLVISTTYVQLSVNHRSSSSSSYEASGGCCCRPLFPMMTGVLEWLEETPPLPFHRHSSRLLGRRPSRPSHHHHPILQHFSATFLEAIYYLINE